MLLKTIKKEKGDTQYTKYVFKEWDLIKKTCVIPSNSCMFFLGYFYFGHIFLSNEKIYISNFDIKYSNDKTPILDTMSLTELYEITLLKDYPKTINDIVLHEIITSAYFEKKAFINKILQWIDEPCDLNEIIDNPYYEVIKFFNSYTKETFKTKRYLFYSKKDNDYSFINNLYAFDLKKHIEMKLYTFDNYSEITRAYMPPLKLSNIVVDDLSQNLSNYQKRECKKAFIELANIKNSYFKVQHYWVMELIKLAIQPVLVLHEWDCHRCFCRPKLFGNIWVYDIPSRDEEPSFFITDKNFTKVAVLKFKSPEYLFKGIYKRAMAKAKGWELTTKEIKELMCFLNSPSDWADDYGSGQLHEAYKKYVKTNWQQLIFEYNHNTAGWGWGDEGFEVPPSGKPNGLEQLPLDLPMPDYTKLIKE